MKRYITTAIVVLCIATLGYAQRFQFKQVRVELWDAVSMPIDSYHNGDSKARWALGATFWYSFDNSPWSCGVFFQSDEARREFDLNNLGRGCLTQKNRSTSLGICGEYAFRKSSNVNPFVDFNLGASYYKVEGDEYIPLHGWSGAAIPKIGVELCHIVRLEAYAQLSRKGFNTYGLALGLVFGK